jgi:HD-GYP domain-containing protein (c-di-GMP phosphodiesterase class II)
MSRSSITVNAAGKSDAVQLEFDTLLEVSRKLSVLPPDEMLNELLLQARKLVHAEAGTVYRVVSDNRLRFAFSQNDARPDLCVLPKAGDESASLKDITIPISNKSLAGYAANNREPLKIDDVYNIPESAAFKFDGKYDESTGYRTVSMLVIPLLDQDEKPVGVLQLINHISAESKPDIFSPRDEQIGMALASMAAISVRNATLVDALRHKNDALKLAQLETIMRLATAAELRDDDTGQHIKRVSMYCETIARRLGLSEEYTYNIMCAAPMHDIGKLGIPDAILTKPGKLTDDERTIMQTHTTEGAKILSGSSHQIMKIAERIAGNHHEKWDGTGYPNGLVGENIPLDGRITAVADVFDALTSKRCYKDAFSIDKAYSIIESSSGSHFDPSIVNAFVSARDEIEMIQETFSDRFEDA